MSKYRIITRNEGKTYEVQRKILWFFWYSIYGAYVTCFSLSEAESVLAIYRGRDSKISPNPAKVVKEYNGSD